MAVVRNAELFGRMDPWEQKNRRRLFLIEKEYQEGLTPSENDELESLQTYASEYVNTRHPLPFGELEKLEEYVHTLNSGA